MLQVLVEQSSHHEAGTLLLCRYPHGRVMVEGELLCYKSSRYKEPPPSIGELVVIGSDSTELVVGSRASIFYVGRTDPYGNVVSAEELEAFEIDDEVLFEESGSGERD